jgi:hypothetical protein
MGRGVAALLCVIFSVVSPALRADFGPEVDLGMRIRGASRAVVATFVSRDARWVTRPSGDRIIVSRVVARIDEALKGPNTGSLVVEIEGGTVGELSMRVSDMEVPTIGTRAVLLVEPTAEGTWRPHRRGLGVMPLETDGRVRGLGLGLDDVRRAARVAGGAR